MRKSYPITFDYNFISQEYPGFGVSDWDTIELSIKSANGSITRLAAKASDDPSMKEDILHFHGNQIPVGLTGWQTISTKIPVSSGKGEFKIMISNEGSGNELHSVLLIDNIRFTIPD